MLESMMQQLGIKADLTREMVIFALVLLRTMPMIFMTPFFGGKVLPGVLKMGLGGMFAALMWPLARGAVTEIPQGMIPIIALMLKEVFVGMVIGFFNQQIFFTMEVAGRLIDTFRGTAMSEVMVPHSKQRATPIGVLYYQMLVVFFLSVGGHHIFFEAYAHSFELIPLDGGFSTYVASNSLPDRIAQITTQMLLMAVLLALPAGAATLITDVVFGLLNRVAPQLNAYFMSMPVKAMAGLVMVLVVMDAFIDRVREYIEWALAGVTEAIRLLAPGPW